MDTPTLVSWAKYVAVALPLIGASATVVLYAEDLTNTLADIRKDQGEIRETQKTIIKTVDRRLDKIEDGHDRIVSEVTRATTALAVEVGRVSGRQERE